MTPASASDGGITDSHGGATVSGQHDSRTAASPTATVEQCSQDNRTPASAGDGGITPRQPPLRGPQLLHQLLTLNVGSVCRVISCKLRPLASGSASTIARTLHEVRRTPRTVRLTTTLTYKHVLSLHRSVRPRCLPLCRKPARGQALHYRRYRAVECSRAGRCRSRDAPTAVAPAHK